MSVRKETRLAKESWLKILCEGRLARDTIIGNDFMDKAWIRLVKERLEFYDPVGELY